ncbi:putative capsular polysaccharide synthesis family protein [Vibrio breoganii]|nr:putative capsular polysaccharide synthesis family protein [Vibrio breoganii]
MLNKSINFYKKWTDESRILIYQMGKVGSTSLEMNLKNSLHFHSLYNNSPCFPHFQQKNNTIVKKLYATLNLFLIRLLIKRRKTIKIITLVRDPMHRDISMFFQDLPFWVSRYILSDKVDTRGEGFDFLSDAFHTSYDIDYGLKWFDKELKRFSGFDVYDHEFNVDGDIIKVDKFEILILKMESMNDHRELINKFLGEEADLVSTNRGEKKWYGPVYKNFKDNVILDSGYIEKVTSSKLYNKFYK